MRDRNRVGPIRRVVGVAQIYRGKRALLSCIGRAFITRVLGQTDPLTQRLLTTSYFPFALDEDSNFEFHHVLLILSFYCDFP